MTRKHYKSSLRNYPFQFQKPSMHWTGCALSYLSELLQIQDQRISLTILLLFPAKSVLWVLLESLLYSVQTIQRLLFGIITVTYEAILSRSHNAQSITNQSGNYMFLKFKQSTIASPTTILTNDFKTIWSLIQHTLLYKECHFKEHKHTTLLHNNNIHNHHMHLSKLHDLNKNSSYWKSLIVLYFSITICVVKFIRTNTIYLNLNWDDF